MKAGRDERDQDLLGSTDWVQRTASADVAVNAEYNEIVLPAGAITLTLPPVQQAKGRWFRFVVVTDGGGNCEVEDRDDARVAAKNYATAGSGLTAIGDELTLFCNGHWYVQMSATLT